MEVFSTDERADEALAAETAFCSDFDEFTVLYSLKHAIARLAVNSLRTTSDEHSEATTANATNEWFSSVF